jgi:uncharacterized repeat protein (TIGR03803 family)
MIWRSVGRFQLRVSVIASGLTVLLLKLVSASAAAAPAFTVLHSFPCCQGLPKAVVFDNANQTLYGVAATSGDTGNGSAFAISSDGGFTTLYSFAGTTDGQAPNNLVQARDGGLYITTQLDGNTSGCGKLVNLMLDGTETTMHGFTGPDGCTPSGLFYSNEGKSILVSTLLGGTVDDGTLSSFNRHLRQTIIRSYDGSAGGCANPGGELKTPYGEIYGTTESGGDYGHGCLYRIARNGAYTVLHSFTGDEGALPVGTLRYQTNTFHQNEVWGVTEYGGLFGGGVVYKFNIDTDDFSVEINMGAPEGPAGNATAGEPGNPGTNPAAGVIVDKHGNTFGTTAFGGDPSCSQGCGTVFELTAAGKFHVLHTFAGTDGAYPNSTLSMDKGGNLYGTTLFGGGSGGTNGFGVVFKVTR